MGKFYIVYIDYKDGVQSIYWTGFKEKDAVKQYRQLTRNGCSGEPYLKAVELSELPNYMAVNQADEQINKLNSQVVRNLDYNCSARLMATSSGGVTMSITTIDKDDREPDDSGRNYKSLCHTIATASPNIKASAIRSFVYGNIVDIIVDKYMRHADIIVPVKIRINGKDYRTYQPNK